MSEKTAADITSKALEREFLDSGRQHTDHKSDSGIFLASGTSGVTVSGNKASWNAQGYQRNANGINVIASGNVLQDNEDSGIQFFRGNNNLAAANVTMGASEIASRVPQGRRCSCPADRRKVNAKGNVVVLWPNTFICWDAALRKENFSGPALPSQMPRNCPRRSSARLPRPDVLGLHFLEALCVVGLQPAVRSPRAVVGGIRDSNRAGRGVNWRFTTEDAPYQAQAPLPHNSGLTSY